MCSLHCVTVINIPHYVSHSVSNFHQLATCQMQKLTNSKNDILRNHLFCSLSYCNLHVTIQICLTPPTDCVPVTLCRNDLGKLNHNILIWGNGFPTCVLQSLWGRMHRRIALEVAPGVGSKERNIGWVPNFSHTPLSTGEVTYQSSVL